MMHFPPPAKLSLLAAAVALGTLTACSSLDQAAPGPVGSIALHNPSTFARADQGLYLSFYDLGVPAIGGTKSLVLLQDGEVIPSEPADRDGDGKKDGIFTVLDFASGENTELVVRYATDALKPLASSKRTQAEISVKEGGQWVDREGAPGIKNYEGGQFKNVDSVTPPAHYTDHSYWIRYEGPGIESDKVGYRVYLDWRNGFDIFGKSQAEPVLQLVGQDGYDSYHEKQPWGMDILKVGSSLGAGGFGYWQDGEVIGLKDVASRSATVVENGNLRSSVRIDYNGWEVAGKKIDVKAYLTMTAGSRLVHNQLTLSEDLPNIAIGIVNHPNTTFIEGETNIASDRYTYLATWGPQSLAGDNLGMAVFFRKRDMNSIQFDQKSRIALLQPGRGEVDYYFAAAWQGELGNKGIASLEEFKRYLQETAESLDRPLRQDLDTQLTNAVTEKPLSAEQAMYWALAMADSELARKALDYRFGGWDAHRKNPPKFEYDIVGMLPFAYDILGDITGDARYKEVKKTVTGSYIKNDGDIERYKKEYFNIDSIAPGRPLLRLYEETGEQKYKLALDRLRDQLHDQPRTSNGAFWHKQRYPGQLWLDGVYMGMPFLAEYAMTFEEGAQRDESLEEVVNEFRVTRKLLRDPATGLYYHAWDEYKKEVWADPQTGLSPNFWSRGMGWMAMALVDVLDYLPEDHAEQRAFLIDMSAEFAKALQTYQDPETGTWWQVTDKPGKTGNYLESTSTAMFTYFLAKAINNGYLTDANFGGDVKAFALKAYSGLLDQFTLIHPDGKVSMTGQCHVAGLGFGRDGSYDYYMDEQVISNDPKGTVPFMLASVEMAKLLKAR